MSSESGDARGIVIAISGKSGCGNSTVSSLVAKRLGLRLINYTFKSIAKEEGVTFEEVCARAERDDSYDRRVDEQQVRLAAGGACVLGSRLAIWLLGSADLRVYLEARLEVRAARIQQREGGRIEDVLKATDERDRRDRARYLRLYGIDIDKYRLADLVIDANDLSQFELAERIVSHVGELEFPA